SSCMCVFTESPTSQFSTLSLHDALPILERQFLWPLERREQLWTRIAHAKIESQIKVARLNGCPVQELESELEAIEVNDVSNRERSEEHTSELQSRFELVCRLLLEKKKNN